MEHDDLDRWLKRDDVIVPSSGFASRVMEAVGREALEPQAIAFPWKFAWPAIVVVLAVAAASLFLIVIVGMPVAAGSNPEAEALSRLILQLATSADIGWMILAAVVSAVPALLSIRFTRARV